MVFCNPSSKLILGWEPKISVVEGLQKTIPYFKEKLKIV